MRRLFAVGLTLLAVSACTVPQPYQPPSPPPEPVSETPPVETQPGSPPSTVEEPQPLPPPVVREPTLGPAARALVGQAQTQLASKNYAVAAGSIERALRIEPNNPLLWIELAKIRQAEGNHVQAENMARKAIATAVQAPKAQAQAWEIVAETYRARGKNIEAQDAAAKAKALQVR
jgi:Tfp pilus assembly protein PilF